MRANAKDPDEAVARNIAVPAEIEGGITSADLAAT